jgi:hypothetical protein
VRQSLSDGEAFSRPTLPPAINVSAKFWMVSGLHLTPQEVAALAQYFLSVGSSDTVPPGFGSYSGNIEDLLAVILRLEQSFEDSLYSPGLQFLTPESGGNLDISKNARTTNGDLIVTANIMDNPELNEEASSSNITQSLKVGYLSMLVLCLFC